MNKITIVTFCLGILLIVSSFINFKKKININYTTPKLNKILNKLLNKFKKNKFISLLINLEISSNKNLLKKIQLIEQCKYANYLNKNKFRINKKEVKEKKIKNPEEILKNVILTKINIFIVVLLLVFVGKYYLSNMVVTESLNSTSIYKKIKYKASKETIDSILNHVDDDYKIYIKNDDINGLKTYIYEYSKANKLEIEQDIIYEICDIYSEAYNQAQTTTMDIIRIFLIALISTFFVNVYIFLEFKIFNVKLLSEFYSLELIALLHMNRDELNVYEILTEVNKYSIYLKPYLTRCLNRYTSNPIMALDSLKKEVNDPNFTGFVLILKSCLENSKHINSDLLEIQRNLRYETDRIKNDKSLEFKKTLLTVAQMPLMLAFILNLILPMFASVDISSLM